MHSPMNTRAINKQSNAYDKIPYPPTNPIVVIITRSRDPRKPPETKNPRSPHLDPNHDDR